MQVPSEYPPSAALLAYSALSIVLLLSLAIAIFEAASALRRKFGAGAATGAEDGGGRATDGSSVAGTALEKTAPGARLGRTKKMSLPEFTWMRHLRRCSRTNPHASADRERRFSHRMSLVHAHAGVSPMSMPATPPRFAVTSCSDVESDVESTSSLGGSTISYSDSHGDGSVGIGPASLSALVGSDASASAPSWCSVSQLKQMGAVRFSPTSNPAARRVSSPNGSTANGLRKFLATNGPSSPSASASRRSYAGLSYYAALPLTPGVARLCGSLTDILESSMAECPTLPQPIDGGASSAAILLRSSDQPQPNSTALEARLKRIRLIRHR